MVGVQADHPNLSILQSSLDVAIIRISPHFICPVFFPQIRNDSLRILKSRPFHKFLQEIPPISPFHFTSFDHHPSSITHPSSSIPPPSIIHHPAITRGMPSSRTASVSSNICRTASSPPSNPLWRRSSTATCCCNLLTQCRLPTGSKAKTTTVESC